MIGKIGRRGNDVGGLLDYLYGPGTDTVHLDPHLVASFDGDPARLEPSERADRPGRYDIRGLARLLEAPLALSHQPPPKHVWHCSLRAAPQDRELTDAEWREAAELVMHTTGIAPHGSEVGCWWVAVRHAPDHIHLVAVLVDQQGKTEKASNDYFRVGDACHQIERRFGLRVTPQADRTATPKPSRAERRRHGPNPALHPRTLLRREAQTAAAAATSLEDYFQHLHDQQIGVRPRYAPDGTLTGYSLRWPGDRVFYGGAKLARDLSLPNLQQRLATTPSPGTPAILDLTQRLAVLTDGAQTVRRIAAAFPTDPAEGDGVAHAAADLLSVTARITSGHDPSPLQQAADGYHQRAARAPHTPVPQLGAAGRALRRLGRSLAALGRLDGEKERSAVAALVAASAELVQAIAAYQTARDRAAHATAARQTAQGLRAALHTLPPPPAPARHPAPTRRPAHSRSNPTTPKTRTRPARRHPAPTQAPRPRP